VLTPGKAKLDAVFISDLHLHPDNALITERFNRFVDWAAAEASTVYILGDFFHVWPGDDALDEWSSAIAARLAWLSQQGVTLYFMQGNRDFLLGKRFADLANMTLLAEPALMQLGETSVLLVHGDRYCTKDRAHQSLRKLTRNRWFPRLFLAIPLILRNKLVAGVRKRSQAKTYNAVSMDVVPEVLLQHMLDCQVTTLIHGHTHRQGVTTYEHEGQTYARYVLSDWDDNPKILCYDKSKGLYFVQMSL